MAAYAGEKPVLLIKKLGALILLLFGVLLTAVGYNSGSTGLSVLGMLLLAAGAILLALKIARRNQPDQL
jgi:hypothetical protein